MEEKHNLIVQLGDRATGKTEFCKRIIQFQKPERCLILDPNCEYIGIPHVREEFMTDTSMKGVYRYCFLDIEKKDRIAVYVNYVVAFQNGLIICEEPMSYEEKFTAKNLISLKDFVGILITRRSSKVNVIINFQDISCLCNPHIICNANIVIYRKHFSSLKRYKKYFTSDVFKKFLQAEETIKNTFLEYDIIKL